MQTTKAYVSAKSARKDIFIGSPVRIEKEGGLLKKLKVPEPGETQDKKKKATDISTLRGSVELFNFMNESAISRIRERVTPSDSVSITKQLLRNNFGKPVDHKEQEETFSKLAETIKDQFNQSFDLGMESFSERFEKPTPKNKNQFRVNAQISA